MSCVHPFVRVRQTYARPPFFCLRPCSRPYMLANRAGGVCCLPSWVEIPPIPPPKRFVSRTGFGSPTGPMRLKEDWSQRARLRLVACQPGMQYMQRMQHMRQCTPRMLLNGGCLAQAGGRGWARGGEDAPAGMPLHALHGACMPHPVASSLARPHRPLPACLPARRLFERHACAPRWPCLRLLTLPLRLPRAKSGGLAAPGMPYANKPLLQECPAPAPGPY